MAELLAVIGEVGRRSAEGLAVGEDIPKDLADTDDRT